MSIEKKEKTVQATAFIDSINLSSTEVLKIFENNSNYRITPILLYKQEDLELWLKIFKKDLYNTTQKGSVIPYKQVYIVDGHRGVHLPIKIPSASKENLQTVEFAGLHGLDVRSVDLCDTLLDEQERLLDTFVRRLDIAIDFFDYVPDEVLQILEKKRPKKVEHKNTIYYKSKNQKSKRNHYINILTYNKTKKEKLTGKNQRIRLEFQFGSNYFKKTTYKNLDETLKKLIKSIHRYSGLNVLIDSKLVYKGSKDFLLDKLCENSKLLLERIMNLNECILQGLLKQENNSLNSFLEKYHHLHTDAQDDINETVPQDIANQNDTMKDWIESKINLFHKEISNSLTCNSNKLDKSIELLDILNTTLYHYKQNQSLSDDVEAIALLDEMSTKMDAIAGAFASLPEWIPAYTLQENTGLSVDAIRKQLLNPKNFEPEVDYIQIGKIWHINKNAIPKVRRQK